MCRRIHHHGVGSSVAATWPFILQETLDCLYSDKFEVINLGREGQFIEEYAINLLHSSFIHKDYFRKEDKDYNLILSEYLNNSANFGWKDLKPDILLLVPVWNDMTNILLRKIPYSFSNTHRGQLISFYWIQEVFSPVFDKTALGYYIKKVLLVKIENAIIKKTVTHLNLEDYMEEIKQTYKKDLTDFIYLFNKHCPDTKIYLVSLPGLFKKQSYSDYTFKNYNHSFPVRYSKKQLEFYASFQGLIEQAVRESMREIKKEWGNIGFIEIPDIANENNKNEGDVNLKLYYDPFHFTYLGNNMIVSYILNNIIDKQRISPRSLKIK